MKNKFILYFIFTIIFQPLLAENLNIQSQQITIDKKTKITIFKDQVIARDQNNNQLSTELAEYNKEMELLNSIGPTTVITENNFIIKGEDIIFDNNNNFIRSTKTATIKDVEGNYITLDNFEYSTEKNFLPGTSKPQDFGASPGYQSSKLPTEQKINSIEIKLLRANR